MLKNFSTVVLLTALIVCFGASRGLAQTVTPDAASRDEEQRSEPNISDNKRFKQNDKLKTDMDRLILDAKAGKVRPSQSQGQPVKSNGLSKGAKIAIGVSIAVAVVGIVLWRVSWH